MLKTEFLNNSLKISGRREILFIISYSAWCIYFLNSFFSFEYIYYFSYFNSLFLPCLSLRIKRKSYFIFCSSNMCVKNLKSSRGFCDFSFPFYFLSSSTFDVSKRFLWKKNLHHLSQDMKNRNVWWNEDLTAWENSKWKVSFVHFSCCK